MNAPDRGRFLAWPGWPHLRLAWLLTLGVAVWFGVVFIGANQFTAHHALRLRVHLDAELHIPLVASFTVVYMSLYALFLAAPFVLRTRREIATLALTQILAITIGGIAFLLIPAQLAYPPPTDSELGMWQPLFVFADHLNLDYNLVPSLHVTLSIVCLELFVPHAGRIGRLLLRSWGILIAASTLLTHQHHVIDVIAGYALAFGVVRLTRCRLHQE